MITQTAIYCAAAALIAALYVQVMLRMARIVKRKFHFSSVNAAMLPFVGLMVALIYLELLAIHDWAPGLEGAIGSATFLGLALGRVLSFAGGAGFSFGGGDMADDGFGDDSDGGSDGD